MSDDNHRDKKLNGDLSILGNAIHENGEGKVRIFSTDENVNQFTEDYYFHAKITLLVLTSKLGRANIVKILLERGANVNTVD